MKTRLFIFRNIIDKEKTVFPTEEIVNKEMTVHSVKKKKLLMKRKLSVLYR